MLDFGFLTIPVVAALSMFVVALFVGDEIVIDKVEVSHQLEWSGYTSLVATRMLTDELRELNDRAASELAGLRVDETRLDKGISAFEDYFQIAPLINGARDALGLVPYYVESEITEKRGEVVLAARVFAKDESVPVRMVIARGDPNNMPAVMHEAALGILDAINPYVVALYHRQAEVAANQFDFPKTNAAVERYLATQPVDEHYLIYGLVGRAHMLRAERDTSLTPEEQQAAYDMSIEYLHAALQQHPDFLYPLINLALIHAVRGEYAVADRYFARAVEVNPNYLTTRRAWGDQLVNQGRLREAAFQYVAAVEIAPGNAELRAKLAQLYADIGQPDAAREQWQEALLIAPLNTAYADGLRAVGGGTACAPGLSAGC